MHNEGNSSARILDAALKLFSAKGYEATSTREICEVAGITKPTLYYFFESKEGVYRALVEAAFQEYEAIIESSLSAPGSVRQKLKRVAESMFERTCAKPELVRFVFSVVYSVNSPFAKLVQASHENMVAHVHDMVSAAAAAGEISPGDVNLRMMVLMGAQVEAISNYLITGRPLLTAELAGAIIDTVFDGWGGRSKGSK